MARIAAIGMVDHDEVLHLERIPRPGGSAIITRVSESPGGTLARLGEQVTFRAVIGNDPEGARLRDGLEREGIDCTMVTTASEPTARSVILLDPESGERTIL
jgi:ribokinase